MVEIAERTLVPSIARIAGRTKTINIFPGTRQPVGSAMQVVVAHADGIRHHAIQKIQGIRGIVPLGNIVPLIDDIPQMGYKRNVFGHHIIGDPFRLPLHRRRIVLGHSLRVGYGNNFKGDREAIHRQRCQNQ